MKKNNGIIALVLIFLSAVFFVFFAIYQGASWGGSDNYAHYHISRYSFKHPYLFFDLWGKPVFNILSSPFSQFGFLGIKIFNVLVALLSSCIVYDISRKLKWNLSYMAIPILLFTPIYFIIIPSGLTEPLFGLVLVLSVWFFFRNQFIAAAIIISFIPFARNEGFVFFPLFLTAFILKKEYRAIPFLGFGFLFFSLIGWPVYKNFFWIFANSKGVGDRGIYGTGSLFHFVNFIDDILGIPVLVLFLIGFAFSTYKVIKDFRKIREEHFFYLLVIGGFFVYFTAHSVVRWLWEGRSLGLIRVIAGVVPLSALVATKGLNEIFRFLRKTKFISISFVVLSASIIVVYPFYVYPVPINIGIDETLIRTSCKWIKEMDLDEELIYYFDPLVPYYLGKDPFDYKQVRAGINDRENPQNGIPQDAIVVWDAHFGPNEGQLPLIKLTQNDFFELLRKFEPQYPFKVLNGYDYEIYVFRRK
jgi:ABC-type cobalt transport system substrate-binding protein